jgi:hypothetical protein
VRNLTESADILDEGTVGRGGDQAPSADIMFPLDTAKTFLNLSLEANSDFCLNSSRAEGL